MKVSQLIYTACGKEKKGNFSTWAKSPDITEEESQCIELVMSYRNKPVDMPYVPTPEDIKKYCPKKYAYFELSSGRKCLAQSNYVSNVYSDFDKRLGNFVIHAFVFDELDDEINPFDLFTCQQFKDELTYKEWHDDPIPESLPILEINPFNVSFSEIEIKETFNKYKEGFKKLLQLILNGLNNDDYLVFDAPDKDLPILYHALGLFLENRLLKDMTFSNLFMLSNDYIFRQKGIRNIKIRSLFRGDNRTPDFYSVESQGGLIASFIENQFSEVQVTSYVEELVNLFFENDISTFLKIKDEINSMKNRIHEDGVTTINVIKFLEKNYASLDLDFNEFLVLLDIVIKNNLLDEKSALLEAYNYCFASDRWSINKQTVSLLKRIYPHLDETQKNDAMKAFEKALPHLVDSSLSPEAYLSSFKEVVLSYEDYVKLFINKDFQLSNFNRNYFHLALLISAIKMGLETGKKLLSNIRAIFMSSMRRHSISEVKLLLEYAINNHSSDFNTEIAYKYVYYHSLVATNSDGLDISLYNSTSDSETLNFGFDVLDIVDRSQKEEYLLTFIDKIYQNIVFPSLYLSRRKVGGIYNVVEENNDRFFFDKLYKKFVPSILSDGAIKEAFSHVDDVLERLKIEYLDLVISSCHNYKGFLNIYNQVKSARRDLFNRYESLRWEWIYEHLYLSIIPSDNGDEEEIEKVFEASTYLDESRRIEYLIALFEKQHNNKNYINLYLKHKEKEGQFYKKLEEELSKKYVVEFDLFRKALVSNEFANKGKLDKDMLEKYFKNHYLTEEDAGIYKEKLEEYFDILIQDRKEKFISYVFDDLLVMFERSKVEPTFMDMLDVYAMIENKVFSLSLSFLVDKLDNNKRRDALIRLTNLLRDNNREPSGMLEPFLTLLDLKKRNNKELIKANAIYSGLNPKQITRMFESGSMVIFESYYDMRKDKKNRFNELFISYFETPVNSNPNLNVILKKKLDKHFKDRYPYFFFTDLVAFALVMEESKLQSFAYVFMEAYFEELSEKDVRRALNDALDVIGGKRAEGAQKIFDYLKEYESQHKKKGLFGR